MSNYSPEPTLDDRASKSRRRQRTRLVLTATVVAIAVAAYAIFKTQSSHAAAPQGPGMQPPKVVVVHPAALELETRLGFPGQFAAANEVELRAQVGGVLTAIHFKDGSIVSKGDPLFTIDPVPYEIKLAEETAALDTANAKLALAERELKRAEELKTEDAGSAQNVDQRTGDHKVALADVHAAEARVRDARFDLERCNITAPFTGRIGSHLVSVGSLIAGGRAGTGSTTLLATLVSSDPIFFNFDMSEADYQLFSQTSAQSSGALGHKVTLALGNESEYKVQGTLDFIDNKLDRSSGTLHARATVPNADQSLKPGTFARARLALGAPTTQLLIPDTSVLPDQSRQVVLTVVPDGTVVPKLVTIGELRGNLRVIKTGLTASDRVIIEGLGFAAPGSKVTPQDGALDASVARAAN